MLTSVFSLNSRLDLFAISDSSIRTKNEFRLQRLVSYDNGETWVKDWITNDVGKLASSAAAAITGDSLDTFIVARGMDHRIWFSRLQELYDFKNAGWSPIGAGVFDGKPAVCSYGNATTDWTNGNKVTSYNGVRVMAFAKGKDTKIWWAYSSNGGNSWDLAWAAIPSGVFSSSPAAVAANNGKLVAVFARGKDDKIWWANSSDGAASWDMAWAPIGAGTFDTMPAAACSADGKRIYVFAKGKDDRVWWAYSTTGGTTWDMAWSPIGDGVFVTMPSASCSWDGRIIHVFGKGKDNRFWQARSEDFGAHWNIAWRKVHSKIFIDVDLPF